MKTLMGKITHVSMAGIFAALLTVVLGLAMTSGVRAEEADAKRILKAMSDYIGTEQAISFGFDATLEVVTTDGQKLGLASSGTLNLNRPDKILFTRTGGVFDIELLFDGKMLTLLGKKFNAYTQVEVPGNLDHLVDELRNTYNRPLPAADLLLTNSYDELMLDVVDVKDLGTGVVGGVACDHLAFRKTAVDYQIWIAQGKDPYPCRYVITSTELNSGPQYTIQFRDWRTGGEVATVDYSFTNKTDAGKVDLKDLRGADDLPDNYKKGESK